ncbi:MAG: SDR family oxidoreductase [Actinomycetota bacterium]|jgi:3-oxoacyl-[acyl-carrier protein] reductase|nr:SDR family oxidoreductase [Actinomycetota bacterium]
MNFGISGRSAVVCASTTGLGEGCARALANEGVQVAVCGRREELAQKIAAELPNAIGIGVDLMDRDGPGHLVDAARQAFGTIDIVVLNGPGPAPGGAEAITRDNLATAMARLLFPHQEIVARVLPEMRAQKWGRIVALGSLAIQAPIAHLALSNIGRAALAAYLKTLAGEVAIDGVTVNIVSPGRISTDRVRQLDAAQADREGRTVEDVATESRARIPMGRYGVQEELGDPVAFLCSERASYITGVVLRCDGGLGASL